VKEAWPLFARVGHIAGVCGDFALAILIVISGILAWAPRIGLSAARETMEARRDRRARLAEIDRTQSPVWGRQARRNALGWSRYAESLHRRFDP
jgi:hypothetical protein